ncbi:MAG: carbohydrate kinase family protein [Promethearchaeota archaeon]
MRLVDIIGLGEVVVDWVAQIDHFPKPDEKVDSISQSLFPGGVTANYCTAVARLGGSVGFMGAVGGDEHGEFLLEDFTGEGVDTIATKIIPGAKTPVNFIFVVTGTGEKTIIQSPYMQTTKLSTDQIDEAYVAAAKVVHTTAIHPDVTEEVLKIARERGVRVSLDLESQVARRGWKKLEPILKRVDLVMPNKEGALALSKTKNVESAGKFFLSAGIDLVVITLGKDGALILREDEKISIPGFEVSVVDTTGAGDTFTAAFDWALHIKNWDLERAGIFANAAAALKCQKLGARTGMPRYQEVVEFLEGHGIQV